jgi:AraC-like DNA-binding protein
MKALIQKIPLTENISFVAKTFRTPNFEVGWHQHIEYELILFTEGIGLSFIGNHIGEFTTGDIYLLGANLPHTFQKRDPATSASAVVIQFKEDFWGAAFLEMPESKNIKELLSRSSFGLKITGHSKLKLQPIIQQLEHATGFNRVLLLGKCLDIISEEKEYVETSTQVLKKLNHKDAAVIEKIFSFTIENFREPITLSQIAAIACISVPAFCNYFKKSTKRTYIDFLNEVRIGYACSLLSDTKTPILQICYESGYNTMVNFHKQFFKLKKITPLQYRKLINGKRSIPQNNFGIIKEIPL